ncbi:hypothetical protein VTO42DRAFT_3369 [Malbranchea cinnamomea]
MERGKEVRRASTSWLSSSEHTGNPALRWEVMVDKQTLFFKRCYLCIFSDPARSESNGPVLWTVSLGGTPPPADARHGNHAPEAVGKALGDNLTLEEWPLLPVATPRSVLRQ